MKTFLDRFRRKGKGDEPSEGVADLFANANGGDAEGGAGRAVADAGTTSKAGGITLTPVPTRPGDDHVRLELGDFLHRIPQNLLRPGPHNVSAELLFNINELSSLIANGHTSINLAEIHRRVPDVFRSVVRTEDKVEIRFPWQKLMHLVKAPVDDANGASGITPAAAEALAQKIRSRRPARNSMPTSGSPAPKVPAAPPTPAFREPDQEQLVLPEKSGAANSQQLSWFSKPGAEKSPDGAITAPRLPATPSPDETLTNFNRDDLVRARDAATLKLAESKAEFERQTDALTAEQEVIAEERNRAVSELARVKVELAAMAAQIEQHEKLGGRHLKETSETIAQRDTLQQEVAAKDAQLAALTAEIATLKNGGAEASSAMLQERDALLTDLTNFRRELAEKNEQIEFHQSMGAKSAEDAARLAAERDALQREIAAKTTELDAIRGELEEMRKGGGEKFAVVAEERDSIRAELVCAREELAAKIGEIETQKSLADVSAGEVATAKAGLESLQKELAEKSSQLASLSAELDFHKKGGTEKVSAIEQERNSLLQLKTKLTDQLAQATAGLAAKQKAVVESDLSRKENQRQLEELQKRIAAFESGQRATAQELTRERETRIKAERSLAAAERARQEASALIESMRSETKRESDSATRKREAEFARAQKGLQERIEALTEANRKVIAERDERIQEIEKVRAEAVASVEAIKSAASAETAKGAQWESRAIAGLEEDIAKYRDRIKVLLGERDTVAAKAKTQIEELTRARDLAAEELEKANAASAKSASEQADVLEELRAKVGTFAQEKTAIFQELDQTRESLAERSEQLAAMQTSAESGSAAAAELREQIRKLTGERDRLQADWEKLFTELESVKAEVKQQSERFAAERAELEKSGDSALFEARNQMAGLQQSLDAATTERADFQRRIEAAATEQVTLLASHQTASDEAAQNMAVQEKLAAELRAEIAELKAGLDTTSSERTALQRQIDEASSRLEQAKAEYEKQLSELRAAHEAQLENHLASSDNLAKTIASHAALVAGLNQQIEESKSAHAVLASERGNVQKDLDAAMALLDQARAEHETQVAKLVAGHAEALSEEQSAAEELSHSVKAQEQIVAELRGEIAALQSASKESEDGRSALQKELDAATALLDQARVEHDAQIGKLSAEHAEALSKQQAVVDETDRIVKDSEKAIEGLRVEITGMKKAARDNEDERAQLQKKVDAAKAEAKKTKADFEKQLTSARAEHAELHTAHQAATNGFSATLLAHEGTVATLRDEIQRHLATSAAAAADLAKAKSGHDQELAAARAEHAELSSKLHSATDDFEEAKAEHATALAALTDELSRNKTDAAGKLESARTAQKELRAQIENQEREFNETKKELEARLADAERASAEIADRAQSLDTIVRNRDNALAERDAAIVRLKEEHEAALTELAREHAAGVDSITAEKDRKLAALTVERAKAVAGLSRERDDLAAKLADVEHSLATQIASLTEARDEAVRESAALAQRLAAFAVESDRKLEDLQSAHDAAVGERQTLSSQLDATREEHRAQSGVFAREFKGIVKQRDDMANALDAARSELAEKTTALAREQANLARVESEVTARFEREVTRMRRERDVLVRQRDELHGRISKMVEEQRDLLEELSAQAVRHSPQPTDVVQKKRAPKETNVIEITAAQIIPRNDPDRGINLPRVRPVHVPPPNVRIL